MCAPTIQALSVLQLADLHTRFLVLLPKIERYGCIYFRHLKAYRKEEVLQEVRSLGWLWFLRLAQRGKDPNDFLVAFSDFLVRAVCNGRRLLGNEKAKDAMCAMTQRRRGFRVKPLPIAKHASRDSRYSMVNGQQDLDAFEERLADNTQTPVPDQVAFRIDWPEWIRTQTDRDRRIIDDLVAGARALDVSRKFGLSPARISQLRRQLRAEWEGFCAEEVAA